MTSTPTTVSRAIPTSFLRWPLIGLGVYVVLDVILQLLPPHYSPLRQAESDLAVGPYGIIMNVNFLLRGALTFTVLAVWRQRVAPSAWERAGEILFAIWAATSALLAFFNTDILDDPRLVPHPVPTWHGDLHIALALMGFIAAPLGAIALSVAWARVRQQSTALTVIAVLALLALLALVPFGHKDLGGLGERIFLFVVLLWTGVAARLLMRSREE